MSRTSSNLALRPYLERIRGICESLSPQELTEVLLSMAKGVPVAKRIEFLGQIEECLPGKKPTPPPDVDDVEELLQDVEALKEAIKERVRAIEDGSYWDDPDEWQHDYYYDEEPDYVTDEQAEELDNLFGAAGDLFISDQMEDARKVYGALLGLVKDIETIAYIPSQLETDIREVRARCCARRISIPSTIERRSYGKDSALQM